MLRERRAECIKEIFNNAELKRSVLHWDGKMLKNLTTHETNDRLPVVVTDGEHEQLLGIPELEDGKGSTQARYIHEVLQDWGFTDKVKAICCDTTASNLGHVSGAAVQLEHLLDRELLYLPCRHHIFELILRIVFETKMPPSSGPNVPLFQRFQNSWNDLNKANYKIGLDNDSLKTVLADHIDEVVSFIDDTMQTKQPRDDYQEFLQLTKIFLGRVPTDEVRFRYPGGLHHARWMAKAIYCLKIYLFRDEFKLTAREEKAISEICTFIIIVYIKAWYTAAQAPQAPNYDLQFIKKLVDYKSIDPKISEVCLQKFGNHLWYLNPETVAMAFFDEELSDEIKKDMINEINCSTEFSESCSKRLYVNKKDIESLCNKELDYFVTRQTLGFFERFQISSEFLKLDPVTWFNNEDFQSGLKVVQGLKVINDTAERAVQLMERYNNLLTKNEKQRQFMLQLISDYNKKFPNATKYSVMEDF